MKQRIKNWFLTHCGLINCCILLCVIIGDVIEGKYYSCIYILPFLITWWCFSCKEKQCNNILSLLDKAKTIIKEYEAIARKYEKNYGKVYLLAQIYLHKYHKEKNTVEFCKHKINLTDYLSKDRWLTSIIEMFEKSLRKKYDCEA